AGVLEHVGVAALKVRTPAQLACGLHTLQPRGGLVAATGSQEEREAEPRDDLDRVLGLQSDAQPTLSPGAANEKALRTKRLAALFGRLLVALGPRVCATPLGAGQSQVVSSRRRATVYGSMLAFGRRSSR